MLLGLVFLVSAVAKFVDMDHFEIHVFSYGLLSLNASFLVARLIVVAEMLVGIGLMSNLWHRFVNACTCLMLAGFTVFLCYAVLVGRTDSCQCMGPLLDIDPAGSILKNVVLLLLLYVGMHCAPFRWQPRWFVWLPVVLAPLVTVFVVSAPDNWLFAPSEEAYGIAEFQKAVSEEGELAELHLNEGRHVVTFVHPKCKFCRMAVQKLSSIQQRHDLDEEDFLFLEPVEDTLAQDLPLDTATFHRPVYQMSVGTFVRITYGQFPMVLLMKDGEVVGTSHYRNINESQIVSFYEKE